MADGLARENGMNGMATAGEGAGASPGAGGLTRTLSPLGVWGLSFGCIIGYGAFSMPGTTFLPLAGPGGTVLALSIGAVLILVIAANYRFLCSRFPDSGGSFAFTRNLFGYDHAFLCAWGLVLAYVSLIWANATAFVHIGRYLFGPVLQVGLHYQVAGYDIYLGEVAVTIAVLVLFGIVACGRKRLLNGANTVLALVLLAGVVVCFAAAVAFASGDFSALEPAFSPGAAPGLEVLGIVMLVPWAFMGFEAVSHTAGECTFSSRKLGPLMAGAVLAGLAVYLMTATMSALGTPAGYAGWVPYIADLGNLEGAASLPTLNAAAVSMGAAGVGLFGVVVFAALSTSMLGFFRAASRLLYCMALDGILPDWFARLNKNHVPANAILFLAAVSAVIPFVGRAAIGWATDTTSISAAIAYGYTSACVLRLARREGRRGFCVLGVLGLVIAVLFLAFPLLPNLWSVGALPAESYLILVAWSIAGLLFFRLVFKRDDKERFGKSPIVWMAMLFLVLFASTMWVRQVTDAAAQQTVVDLSTYYAAEFNAHDVVLDAADVRNEEAQLQGEADSIEVTLMNGSTFQIVLVMVSLIVMYSLYNLMLRRQRSQEARRLAAEGASLAKTTFLANMSHDIRTPMNAIIGYAHLAQREDVTLDEAREYLGKIDASSKHLLGLINDVLEMSRIESGRMDLAPVATDLRRLIADTRDLFAVQMQQKGIAFTAGAQGVRDALVMCDAEHLDRVLLNLVGNAYKFTPAGGSVDVSLAQVGDAADGRVPFELRVRDTGIGMAPEFAERVFDAFERERNTTASGIEGTGLGMAITKNIVEAMGGTIDVVTAPGEGTEFIVKLEFELAARGAEADGANVAPAAAPGAGPEGGQPVDFAGKRILVVEDNDINREIATLILEDAGFTVETAENGQVALDMLTSAGPGRFDVVLSDVRMPVMDGREATRRIRALPDPELAGIPIVACAANAFADDVQENLDAGMDAFVAKPLDVDQLLSTLSSLLR